MSHDTTRVLITGQAAGWSVPVMGPDGVQLSAPIPGSGTHVAVPMWTHYMGHHGETHDLPTSELERLADHITILEDQGAPLTGAPTSPWDAIRRIFTASGAPAEPGAPLSAPVAPKAPADQVAPADASEAAQATAAPQDGPVAQGSGWYVLPDGSKVRMSKDEAAAWTAPAAE